MTPSFDPNLPVDGSLIEAGELRAQFVSLENEIEALSERIDPLEQRGEGLQPLGLTISDPPTQAEVQAVLDKVNELVAVLGH